MNLLPDETPETPADQTPAALPPSGDQLKNEGIERLAKKQKSPAVAAWCENFRQTIIQFGLTGNVFTADQVRAACPPPVKDPTYSPNMMPAAYNAVKRQGLIRDWQYGVKSTEPSRHSGKNPTYIGTQKASPEIAIT